MVTSLKTKLKQEAFKRFLKRDQASISRRDSGNEFHTLGDAYENMNWDQGRTQKFFNGGVEFFKKQPVPNCS